MDDLILAHKFSANHQEQLKCDSICGCFDCLAIFHPNEIEHFMKITVVKSVAWSEFNNCFPSCV